jgi:MFS family permease
MGRTHRDQLFTPSFVRICIGNFLLFMGFYLLLPVLPLYLLEEFHASGTQIGVTLALYTVAALLARPFSGFVADRFSRKPVYLIFYLAFTLLFINYPLVNTLLLFALLRIFHGMAFGMVTTAGNTLVVDILPSSRRGEGLGYFGVANNLAMAIGPMVGLMLHDAFHSFDALFYTALGCGTIGFFFAYSVKVAKKPKAIAEPMSLDRFFLLKGLRAGLCLLLISIPYGITTSYVALYAREINVMGSMGLFFSLLAAGMIVSRTFAGTRIDRGQLLQVITVGMSIVCVAFFLFSGLSLLPFSLIYLTSVLFFLVPLLLGVGYGMVFPAYNTLFVDLAPHNRRATASSTYLTSWDVGIGIGLVLGGRMVDLTGLGAAYLLGSLLVLASVFLFVSQVAPHFKRNKLR